MLSEPAVADKCSGYAKKTGFGFIDTSTLICQTEKPQGQTCKKSKFSDAKNFVYTQVCKLDGDYEWIANPKPSDYKIKAGFLTTYSVKIQNAECFSAFVNNQQQITDIYFCDKGRSKAFDFNELKALFKDIKKTGSRINRLTSWSASEEAKPSESNSSDENPSNSADSKSTKMKEAVKQCSNLGFQQGTEKHGDCVLKLIEHEDKDASKINTSRWLNVRESSTADLYVDEQGQYIKIKASNKWYDKLHERYNKAPNTDIRIGFYYSNDTSYKPKKYEYEIVQPSEIQATKEGNAKVFIFKTTAVNKLRTLKSKYIYFMVTDYEKGAWYWTRTINSE